MEITQVKTSDLTAELHVQLKPEDYKEKVNEELKRQSKQVSIPGFRSGKVPLNLVRKMLGVSVVMDQVNKMVSHDLIHYIQDQELNILGEPLAMEMKSEEDFDLYCEKEMAFTFEVGLAPAIEMDWDKINVPPRYAIKVDDAFLDKEIDNYIDRFGEVTNPEEAEEGDILYGRVFEVNDEGEAVENGFDRMVAFNPDRIDNKKFLKPFLGLKIEDKKDVDLFSMAKKPKEVAEILFMEEEEIKELNGKKLQFELKKINRVTKAEMSQAFFEKVGNAYGWENPDQVNDEETFRKILSEKMEEELKESASHQFRNDLQKAIMDKQKFSLPDEFLKKWLIKSKEYTEEKLEDEFDGVLESVRWSLVIEKLKDEVDVNIEEEEVKAAVRASMQRMLLHSGMDASPEMLEQYMDYAMSNQEMVDQEYQKLLNERIYEGLEAKLEPEDKEIKATKFVEMIEREREKEQKNR